ncbi:MAG TPA: solute carrier family 23 protein [Candidatus Didemnitutus sp.]|nr:solute carrier family 23 protein [Candidatus Didemnitutus sp.]
MLATFAYYAKNFGGGWRESWLAACFGQRTPLMQDLPPPVVSPVTASPIVYGLEDRVPAGTAFLVGAQHVTAMVVGTITPPLLLASSLKFSSADTAYFISIALLSSALGTFLQCRRRGPVGSGLLSVTGTSFAFISVLMQAWSAGGLALMFGLSCLAAPLQIVLSPFLPRLRAVFTPLVCGIIVLLIGASLIPTAYFSLSTPLHPGAPPWQGLAVGALVVAIVVATQATGKSWARIAGVALAVVVGSAVCLALGGLQPPPAGDGAWLTQPRFLPHGFSFSWALVLPFGFIYLVSLLEALGDMTATAQLSGLPTDGPDYWKRLSGGVLADGITSTVSALFGGFPSATYAQNNGVIQITGVASRRVGYAMAAILAVLGLFPVVGRWITVLPPPVIGALAALLFGLVAVSGLRIIFGAGLGQREGIIVALSLGVGLGLPTQPGLLTGVPPILHSLLESSVSAGGLTALLLNLAWPASKST